MERPKPRSGDTSRFASVRYDRKRGEMMSFRNGDKSRENRIRKARQKKREVVRELKSRDAGSQAAQPRKKSA
jgi:hypothetical protein